MIPVGVRHDLLLLLLLLLLLRRRGRGSRSVEGPGSDT